MKSTIMIPAYNVGNFLPKAIESCLEQKVLEKPEILIVNDGSTDDTKDVIEYYQRGNSQIRAIHQKNKGQGITRNILLEKSRGDVLFGLDGDDFLEPYALSSVLRIFENSPDIGFVYTDQREIDEAGKLIGERRRTEVHNYFSSLITHCQFAGHLRAFRKSHIKNLRFDPEHITAQDWDFLFKILETSTKIAHVPEVLYNYRINTNGISLTKGSMVLDMSVSMIKDYLKRNANYGNQDFKVSPVEVAQGIRYYDHLINGKSIMNSQARDTLIKYLKEGI